MLKLIADGMQAYNQVGLFIGALFCLAFGCFLFGYSLYERMRAVRAVGTIVGVIHDGGMFRPVYRYMAADGQPQLARSPVNSSWSRGKETGRVVPLLISARNPAEAREARSYLLDIVGVVLAGCGLWLGYAALTAYPTTVMTGLVTIVMIVILAERGYRLVVRKHPDFSIAQWRQYVRPRETAPVDLASVTPIEQILASPERRETELRQYKVAAPLLVLFAVVLAGVGVHQSMKLMRLEATGLRAHGEVVRLQKESSSGDSGYVYVPVVRFRTDRGALVEFKDRMGSNPPAHRRGDKVTVLYLADSPQPSAVIDRGWWGNWAIPAIALLAAAFVLWLFIMMVRNGILQRNSGRVGEPPQRRGKGAAPASR